jgi:hypothetical protein
LVVDDINGELGAAGRLLEAGNAALLVDPTDLDRLARRRATSSLTSGPAGAAGSVSTGAVSTAAADVPGAAVVVGAGVAAAAVVGAAVVVDSADEHAASTSAAMSAAPTASCFMGSSLSHHHHPWE